MTSLKIPRRTAARLLPGVLFIILSLSLAGCSPGADTVAGDRETLYQVSTIDALLNGVYDGFVTLEESGGHGDFGIGTFDRLDGEMVELDGLFYRVAYDGGVSVVDGAALTPFVCTTFFDADRELALAGGTDYAAFQEFLDGRLPTANIFYAVRIDGTFSHVRTRSVPAQEKPYPPLTEVTQRQAVFELSDVTGTIVGFRCPPDVGGLNVAGYHLHFLTEGRDAGGHVLDFTVEEAAVLVDDTAAFRLVLPGPESDFYLMDLAEQEQAEVAKAEK